MFKSLFRLTFVTFIWSRYKTFIVSTLAFFFFYWFVGKVHADYLTYVKLEDVKGYVGASFFLKWGAIVVGVLVYAFVNLRLGKTADPGDGMIANKGEKTSKANRVSPHSSSDPFSHLREKDTLRTKADFIIEKESPPKR